MRLWLALLGSHVWAGLLESLWLGIVRTPAGEWSLVTGLVEAYALRSVDGFPSLVLAAGDAALSFVSRVTIWDYAYLSGLTGIMLRGLLIAGSIVAVGMGAGQFFPGLSGRWPRLGGN